MKSLLSKCILILTVTHGLNVAAATVAEERETEFTALRQKIEKKIGLEKLQILDKLGGEIFTKWSDRQAATGSAQTYFRGGKIGTDEEKKILTEAYMSIKGGQGCILAAEFHQDPEWRKFTQAYFDCMKANGGLERQGRYLESYDKINDYQEGSGSMDTADDFFSESAKRRSKIQGLPLAFSMATKFQTDTWKESATMQPLNYGRILETRISLICMRIIQDTENWRKCWENSTKLLICKIRIPHAEGLSPETSAQASFSLP